MPTATGRIDRSDSLDKITGTFTVEGVRQIFTANISESVPTFVSSNATLTYSSIDDLTGTRVFAGIIGATTVTISIGNGPTIAGDLDSSIGQAFTVNGSGNWETN
ncbi:hypothetical protein CERSUDRAFT_115158 [Gelatoporia subvermispora B]|uniref:Uncharacterized protein n=1 Tax=Ceriporiopsis subvermispora (strain B) TaxID=914234 RepID=M2QGN8_CERS8|nr:hypothetical protein CERSUDRAFT_115158 [Gelatoporia subvermispora B]